MSERVRLCLVGCGAISEWHRNAIAQVPEIAISACVDVDRARAEAAAAATGAAVFTSLDEALSSNAFDAVDLMLPHDLHEEIAVTCLQAGKHVLLEKPMAPTVAACERILAAAGEAPGVFMVAENAQYWPEALIAKQLIEDGRIGDIVTAQVHLFFPPMEMYYGKDQGEPDPGEPDPGKQDPGKQDPDSPDASAEVPWRMRSERAGGGVSIDTGSHYIRPLRMCLGEIDEVVAAMERPYSRMQGESLARALFRFESGVVASFDILLTDAPVGPQEIFRITGTRGELLIGLDVKIVDAEHRRPTPAAPDTPQGYMLSYPGQFRDFASAVLHGRPLAAGPEVALGELRTALAMARSALSRRWEKVF